MKTNLKIIIPIIISIAVIIAALLLIKFEPNQKSGDISPLSTAQKYLTELNYEQAIIEFKKAIELDPMNADAYLGLAQAYEKLGDIENAVAELEKGYKLTGDERLKAALSDLLAVSQPQITDGIYIPEIDGMSKEDLETLFTELEVRYKINQRYHDSIPKGQIISDNIPKDRIIKKGRRVDVFFSLGKENISLCGEELSPYIKEINLSDRDLSDSDILALPRFKELERLDISLNNIKNIASIKEVKTLKWIDITGTLIDVEQAQELQTALPDCTIVNNFCCRYYDSEYERKYIIYNTDVTEVSLAGLNVTDYDINDIKILSRLERLDLSQNYSLDDISYITELKSLKYINVTGTHYSRAEIEQLRQAVPDCEIVQGTFLMGGNYSTDITTLSIHCATDEDIDNSSEFTNLQKLYLSWSYIHDYSFLEKMPQLTDLSLSINMKGSDTSEFENVCILERCDCFTVLKNLTGLDLTNHNIKDFSPLYSMKSLKKLYIWYNPISAEELEKLKAALPDCEIYGEAEDKADDEIKARIDAWLGNDT